MDVDDFCAADDDGDDGASSGAGPSIELGFAERVEPGDGDGAAISSLHTPDWDGGKAGGPPVWLHPAALPAPAELTCAHCARPLLLLAQLYAPVEPPAVPHAGAFHRMLYVFACGRGECVNRASSSSSSSSTSAAAPSVRVLRCQLPQANPFHRGKRVAAAGAQVAPTCAMCGLAGPTRCSACRAAHYCSRAHQAAHWRVGGHKAACAGAAAAGVAAATGGTAGVPAHYNEAASVAAGCVLPEHEIIIEREPGEAERRRREVASLPAASAQALRDVQAATAAVGAGATVASGAAAAAAAAAAATVAAASSSGGPDDEGGEGGGGMEVDEASLSIDDLTQRALAETTGARLFADDVMRYFQRRVAAEPSQVIRYCRWPPPGDDAAPRLTLQRSGGGPARGEGGGRVASGGDGVEQRIAGSEEEEEEGTGSAGGVRPPAGTDALGGRVEVEEKKEAEAVVAAAAEEDEELELDADGEPFGAPLWLTASNQPTAAAVAAPTGPAIIPPCPRCGSERRFEFQVMPQLLNYVLASSGGGSSGGSSASGSGSGSGGDASSTVVDLDFGTIAVYTCTTSCEAAPLGGAGGEAAPGGGGGGGSAACSPYVPEFAWVQPMREEEEELAVATRAGGGGVGGAAAGSSSSSSIMQEALRRVEQARRARGAAGSG